ncbi:NAD(P)-binding protein [Metschnikowia bicuspidata var. bicuspidata NRRL YB-4993]|uniref:D-xylose 1-dehydrogenase (NADP(+), D-xylono-1,5-lactone-forming) n=1 Tax=Metschnikowia bicuspidata var. bicuspidata NRRL YB-4993 TaxID=869754 RepID=A0A1A0HHK2_9ASCO|nr:NAD(P)-binding protein [Metschnikowia bicuspidata var. bicuspidata NRRL YB-4993]OBA23323.1 NAD(P)-binding protein [Metschnikowia bicuspidata var. bicuspidata NRRL YB-4993]
MSLRWGILGAGNISGQFVHDLVASNKNGDNAHVIISVGSSDTGRGESFLQKHGVAPESNQGVAPVAQIYTDFFCNPQIDIVYIGTPHTCHKDQVMRALRHGKHVLCEKPFTVTGADAREVWAEAEKSGLFVMEAVWTRFFPLVGHARRLLHEQKVLGDVHRMTADFSMAADVASLPKTSRARDIGLAAGATLDVGIYPLTYMRALLAGSSSAGFEVKSFLTLDPEDRVDHVATYIVKFDDGKQAVLTSSNHVDGPSPFLRVEGTHGTLEMYAHNPAQPQKIRVVYRDGRDDLELRDDTVTSGYNGFIHEANAVAAAIKAGQKECAVMPWSETQLMMDTMDQIRWENKLYYKEDNR